MNLFPIIFLAAVGLAVLIYLLVLAAKAAAERDRQRKAELSNWAMKNGFGFYEKDRFDLDARYNGMGGIGTGHSRYAFEVLQRSDPAESFIFRYHFATTETRTVTSTDSNGNSHTRTETYEQDHWHAYLVIELQAAFPQLTIRPEHWGDKVAGFLGFDDIDFESEQFSSRYFVKSADKQFAYAVIHPQMMEWLMEKKFVGQLERGFFLIDLSAGKFDAQSCAEAWAEAVGFVNRIPPFVWQDYGKRAAVVLPNLVSSAQAPPIVVEQRSVS